MTVRETAPERADRLYAEWQQARSVTDAECSQIGQLLCDHDPRDLALAIVRLSGHAAAFDFLG